MKTEPVWASGVRATSFQYLLPELVNLLPRGTTAPPPLKLIAGSEYPSSATSSPLLLPVHSEPHLDPTSRPHRKLLPPPSFPQVFASSSAHGPGDRPPTILGWKANPAHRETYRSTPEPVANPPRYVSPPMTLQLQLPAVAQGDSQAQGGGEVVPVPLEHGLEIDSKRDWEDVVLHEASPNGGNRRSTIWSRPSNHRYGTRSANPDDDEDAVAIDVDVEEAAPPTPTPALHRVLWNDESDGLLLNILGYATFISWGMYEAAGTELGGRTGNSVRSRLDHLRKKHKHAKRKAPSHSSDFDQTSRPTEQVLRGTGSKIRWSSEEDSRLSDIVAGRSTFEVNWNHEAPQFGRTPAAVRQRWIQSKGNRSSKYNDRPRTRGRFVVDGGVLSARSPPSHDSQFTLPYPSPIPSYVSPSPSPSSSPSSSSSLHPNPSPTPGEGDNWTAGVVTCMGGFGPEDSDA